MSVQVENLEHSMAKLTVEVPAEDVEKALQAAYLKQRKSITLPGFRKGKVPRQMIEKMYGPEVFYEDAVDKMVSDTYGTAYDESGLDIVSQPSIDIVQIEKGKPFIYTAEVAVKPEVTLGEYKGLSVDPVSAEVTDDDIEAEIRAELERNARTVEVTDRAVQDKDEITLDFEGFVDGVAFEGGKGTDYPLTIGSGSFIPGFEEQLIGAEIEQELEVNVTFPEEYQEASLAGKDAVFKCTVHTIKAKEIPELDEEFVEDVSEDAETVEDYRAEIAEKLKTRRESEKKEKIENQAVDKAVANAEIDVPGPMIDMQAKQMVEDMERRISQQGITPEKYYELMGVSAETVLESTKPQAEQRIRSRLVLEAVVKAENIEISDERLDEEIEKMAQSYQMEADKFKELLGDYEITQMKEDLAVQEAVTLIGEAAVETEKAEELEAEAEAEAAAAEETPAEE